MTSSGERGWQPGDPESHGFLDNQPQLRAPLEGSTNPEIVAAAAELPEKAKETAHREIEITRQLTKEELDAGIQTLETQGAERVQECTIEQVWYDMKPICDLLPQNSETLGALATCRTMQVRVRSLTYTNGVVEYHWAIKLKVGEGSDERIEIEDTSPSWDAALAALNSEIRVVLNTDLHQHAVQPLTESSELRRVTKHRVSYRYPNQDKRFPCTGMQVDFDVYTKCTTSAGTVTGSLDTPLLISVDVEGPVLHAEPKPDSGEDPRRVPSIENCAWCLSIPENKFQLFAALDSQISLR